MRTGIRFTITRCWAVGFMVVVTLLEVGCRGRERDAVTRPADHFSSWPGWRGARRDGITEEKNWRTQWGDRGVKTLWRRRVGAGCSSMAIDAGRLYTSGNENNQDTLFCLDAASGAVKWKFNYACPLAPAGFEGGPCATPAVDGPRVYTISREGELFCLEVTTGQRVWSRHATRDLGMARPPWGFSGSPLVLPGCVVANVGAVIAFNKETGEILWKTGNIEAVYSSPIDAVIRGRRVVVANSEKAGLALFDAQDGREIVRHPYPSPVKVCTPMIKDDQVLLTAAEHTATRLLALGDTAISELWQDKNLLQTWVSTPVLWRGYLYGFNGDDLCCAEYKTGRVAWIKAGIGEGSLLLADGRLVIQGGKGDLIVADASPERYCEQARQQVFAERSWVMPALCDGRLYCKSNRGQLVCLDLRAGRD